MTREWPVANGYAASGRTRARMRNVRPAELEENR